MDNPQDTRSLGVYRVNRDKTQYAEAVDGTGSNSFDVVLASFGGNDLDFDTVIMDCIGIDEAIAGAAFGGSAGGWAGAVIGAVAGKVSGRCPTNLDAELRDDIDEVASPNLHRLYDQFAEVTTEGALIVVAGYPQLFEDPTTSWSQANAFTRRCHGMHFDDADMLRGLAGRFNQAIGAEVKAAAERHPERTWVFADVSLPFDGHGLCSDRGHPWINGLTTGLSDGDFRLQRSFHPTQEGHTAGYATFISDFKQVKGWRPAEGAKQTSPDLKRGTVVLPDDACIDILEYTANIERPLRLVDGEVPISESLHGGASPYVGIDSDHSNGITTADLDDDGNPEIAAIIVCGTGGSGAWNEIAVFNSDLEPLGIVPMGEGVDPPWEFTIQTLQIRDQVIEVVYIGGEEDEPLCCGTRLITDSFTYQDGLFVRTERVQVTGLTWINDFLEAVNARDRSRALRLGTMEVVDQALANLADRGRFELCNESLGELSINDGTSDRICYATTADGTWLLRAAPQDLAFWQVTQLDFLGAE